VPPAFQKLNVFLRGSRSYVQGSQILGRTADWLFEAGLDDAILVDAKFSQITSHPIIAFGLGDERPDIQGVPIGQARYRRGDDLIEILYANAATCPAPWIGDQASKLESFTDHGDLSGEARVALDGTQEGYLAAVIETVKKLHQSLATEVEDIWFTALTGAALPITPNDSETASITVAPLLARNHDGRKQTFSSVTVADETGQPIQFNIAFSCLIAEA